jgi:hypothetical protein
MMDMFPMIFEIVASTLELITAALKLISAVIRTKKISPDKD